MKRKLAQISGGALGFIGGNVGGALLGARYAGRAYDYIHPEAFQEIDDNPFVKRPKLGPSSFTKKIMALPKSVRRLIPYESKKNWLARSRRMLRKPRTRKRKYVKRKTAVKSRKRKMVRKMKKRSVKKVSFMTQALRKGFGTTYENYGGVSDPNACYIIHSTYARNAWARCIVGAVLRKLFHKAGLHIGDLDTELPWYEINNSDGFKVTCEIKAIDGSISFFEKQTADNETFKGFMTGWVGLRDYILSMLDDASASVFTRIVLYSSDRNGVGPDTTNWRFHTALNLETEKLNFYSSSLLKVQNRTRGDQQTYPNDIAQAVDEQNLNARMYTFKNGHPRVKNLTTFNHEWSTIQAVGIDLIRSASFPVVDYQNMPSTGVFSNCSSSKSVVVGSGRVIQGKVTWQKSGLFNAMLKKLSVDFYSGSLAQTVVGKSQMLGVEELIRTDSNNIIQLKYERRHECGVFLTSAKPPVSVLKELDYGMLNNYAP